MPNEQRKPDHEGRLANRGKYLGPVVTAVVLFVGTVVWALGEKSSTERREIDQLVRYTHSLARGLMIAADNAGFADDRDRELRRTVADHLRLRWPFLYVAIVRGQDPVATEANLNHLDGSDLQPGMHANGVFVVRMPLLGSQPPPRLQPGDRPPPPPPNEARPLHRPPPGDTPPPPHPDEAPKPGMALPWDWAPNEQQPRREAAEAPLDLVAGFDPLVNPRALREAVIRVIATLLVAWAAIAALSRAWVRSIRARDLQAALENERRERSRLVEMSLAAAGLAHETKNPLGLILGLAQRLNADASTPPATKEVAEQIMDAADHATARLSDFMNFARLPTPHLQDTDASELLRRVVATMKADFDEVGVGLALVAEALRIRCDPAMLEQVMVNLLLNSLQASVAGSATSVHFARHGSRWTISVVDQGHGIPAHLLPDIFKPYVTGRPDGHGLGLAIVKRIVDQHGWSIAVDSSPGRGTSFTLTGPVLAKSEEQS